MTCRHLTYRAESADEAVPKNAAKVYRKAFEEGWHTCICVNLEHQSVAVKFARFDNPRALPGYAAWKDGRFTDAVVSNLPWAERRNMDRLVSQPLNYRDVLVYLADTEVIWDEEPEEEKQ